LLFPRGPGGAFARSEKSYEVEMPFPMDSLEQLQGFLWIFIRVGVVLFLLPLFGAKGVPSLWKIGFSLILALVLLPVVPPPGMFPQGTLGVLAAVLSEFLLGFVLALGVNLLMNSVQLAGQFLGFQMGFNMASAMDPETGGQSVVISQALYLFTVLILFAVNGHHLFIRALAASFQVVPPGAFRPTGPLLHAVIRISSEMFVIALKMAAPIMIALFLSNLSLGIVARTVPQVNILMVGFPLNICLGLLLFALVLTNLSPFLVSLIRRMGEVLQGLLRMM
jgi:flagellar biosynthetic protein FliR